MKYHKFIILIQNGIFQILLQIEVKSIAKKYKVLVEILLECKNICTEEEHVNKITNASIGCVKIKNVKEEMIQHHAQTIKIVVQNIIAMCQKIIHIYHNAKFFELLMNSVVKPMNVGRVFIVAMLILGQLHCTIIGKIIKHH